MPPVYPLSQIECLSQRERVFYSMLMCLSDIPQSKEGGGVIGGFTSKHAEGNEKIEVCTLSLSEQLS
jgi:hypothetical protein